MMTFRDQKIGDQEKRACRVKAVVEVAGIEQTTSNNALFVYHSEVHKAREDIVRTGIKMRAYLDRENSGSEGAS